MCVAAVPVLACAESAGSVDVEPPGPSWPGTITELLELVPMPVGADEGIEVRIGDAARASAIVGSPRPADMDDRLVLADWMNGVYSGRTPHGGPPRPTPAAVPYPDAVHPDAGEEWFGDEGRGWTLLDVDWFVEATPPGHSPDLVGVIGGDIGSERLTGGLGAPDSGVWSRDPAAVGERDRLHTGMWVHAGLADGHLVVSNDIGAVRDGLDGRGTRLAANPILVDLAEALDDQDAYGALLVHRPGGFPFSQHRSNPLPGVVERARDSGRLLPRPFTGAGFALAADGDGPVAVLVYVHGSADDASANADTLRGIIEVGENYFTRRPMSESFTVEDVVAEGTVVTAQLRIADGVFLTEVYRLADDPTMATHG